MPASHDGWLAYGGGNPGRHDMVPGEQAMLGFDDGERVEALRGGG